MSKIWTVDSDRSPLGDRTCTRCVPSIRRSRKSIDVHGSDHYAQLHYGVEDYDLDEDFPAAKMMKTGLRACWNDILIATGQPILSSCKGGWDPITLTPPKDMPDLSRFAIPWKLDLSFMRTLAEFRHWKHDEFGNEAQWHDVRLIESGKVSLVYLFLRGPVYLRWYGIVTKLPAFEKRDAFRTHIEVYGDRIEQYLEEERQVKHDFREVARVFELEHGSTWARVQTYTPQNASPATLFEHPRNRARKAPTHTDKAKEMHRSASDAFLCPGAAPQPPRAHNSPASRDCNPPSRSAYTGYSTSRPAELNFGDMPPIQVRSQPITEAEPSSQLRRPQATKPIVSDEETTLAEAHYRCDEYERNMATVRAEVNPSTAPFPNLFCPNNPPDVVSLSSTKDDVTQRSQSDRALGLLQQLNTELVDANRVAAECCVMLRQIRAQREGADEFGVGSGDLGGEMGSEGKGKELMREA